MTETSKRGGGNAAPPPEPPMATTADLAPAVRALDLDDLEYHAMVQIEYDGATQGRPMDFQAGEVLEIKRGDAVLASLRFVEIVAVVRPRPEGGEGA